MSVKLLIYIASKPIAHKIGNNIKVLILFIKTKSSGQKKYFFRLVFRLYNSQFFLQTRVNYSPFTIFLFKSTACEIICRIERGKKG
ncbi:MAG: hypothetical protein EBT87_08575 [Alphaproteobacteria bacterium]|nr:hypothetical protein [Alphaproteobacteria bacterium]